MTRTPLEELLRCPGVTLHAPVDAESVIALSNARGFCLPAAHIDVLRQTNGIEAYHGYLRLFGVGDSHSIDSLLWNRQDCWKMAWSGRCDAYWCFGETAWGDQYAYRIESLVRGGDCEVLCLDCLSMTPEAIAPSFASFFEQEFVRSARQPYDVMTQLAFERFGPLSADTHLVYAPSLLLGAPEDIANVQVMDARSAMICNGDLAVQLEAGPENGFVTGIETYADPIGCQRIRVI